MGYVNLKIEGSNQIYQTLGVIEDVPGLAREALQAGADVLLPIEKANAPVGPSGGGHIRDRLEVRVKGQTAYVGVWNEPVAYYVEYGHGGPHPAPAHPYMAPAAESAEDAVTEAIMDVIGRFIDGA